MRRIYVTACAEERFLVSDVEPVVGRYGRELPEGATYTVVGHWHGSNGGKGSICGIARERLVKLGAQFDRADEHACPDCSRDLGELEQRIPERRPR